jgi:hypothetical protein
LKTKSAGKKRPAIFGGSRSKRFLERGDIVPHLRDMATWRTEETARYRCYFASIDEDKA